MKLFSVIYGLNSTILESFSWASAPPYLSTWTREDGLLPSDLSFYRCCTCAMSFWSFYYPSNEEGNWWRKNLGAVTWFFWWNGWFLTPPVSGATALQTPYKASSWSMIPFFFSDVFSDGISKPLVLMFFLDSASSRTSSSFAVRNLALSPLWVL